MTMKELKAKLASDRREMALKSGKQMLISENGPAGFGLIDGIISVLEAQQKQIDALEQRLKK